MIVKQFHHKNQFVIKEVGNITFQSYGSTICELEPQGDYLIKMTVHKNWNYSQTTLKHFYKFLEEYAPAIYYFYLEKKQNKEQAMKKLFNFRHKIMIDDGIWYYEIKLI